ncbi:MAG TPA: hypothetical protein VL400_14755 [Polyangiaceae bacterium]|jgi:hypothetical protein|nr:hypothetical protein [Polyangiaceae bacterium]
MLRPALALATAVSLVALLGPGCSSTTVFDNPDPKGCPPGHGCPMVGCACNDGSVVLDSTCELGKCLAPEKVCNDRCDGHDGAKSAFTSDDDEVPVPDCDTFCTRLEINGCPLGCDTLFSQCKTPTTCDPAAAAFWQCVTEDAVIDCNADGARITGCDVSEYGLCQ